MYKFFFSILEKCIKCSQYVNNDLNVLRGMREVSMKDVHSSFWKTFIQSKRIQKDQIGTG
jgi:hypothetical protein